MGMSTKTREGFNREIGKLKSEIEELQRTMEMKEAMFEEAQQKLSDNVKRIESLQNELSVSCD